MAKESISFPIDEEIKIKADILFKELGLSTEEAIIVFLKQSIIERGIPFEIKLNVLNKEYDFEFIYVEALKALIDKGYSNDELVEAFKKDINLMKLAKQNMLEESKKIASGEISGVSFEEIFHE